MKAKNIRISIISINADRVDFGCRILDYGGFRAAEFAEQWDCVFDFNFPIIYSACKGYAFSLTLSLSLSLWDHKPRWRKRGRGKRKREKTKWAKQSGTRNCEVSLVPHLSSSLYGFKHWLGQIFSGTSREISICQCWNRLCSTHTLNSFR